MDQSACINELLPVLALEKLGFLHDAAPRQVPTSASIQQLQKVKNMRDLAEVCSGIAPGNMYNKLLRLIRPMTDQHMRAIAQQSLPQNTLARL